MKINAEKIDAFRKRLKDEFHEEVSFVAANHLLWPDSMEEVSIAFYPIVREEQLATEPWDWLDQERLSARQLLDCRRGSFH